LANRVQFKIELIGQSESFVLHRRKLFAAPLDVERTYSLVSNTFIYLEAGLTLSLPHSLSKPISSHRAFRPIDRNHTQVVSPMPLRNQIEPRPTQTTAVKAFGFQSPALIRPSD
jgi:hypothetical protein